MKNYKFSKNEWTSVKLLQTNKGTTPAGSIWQKTMIIDGQNRATENENQWLMKDWLKVPDTPGQY